MGANAMTAIARNDGARATVTVCARCYREHEKARILAALMANSSLLVVNGPGMGKSTLYQLALVFEGRLPLPLPGTFKHWLS
jgi:MoxR-like ATPase